MKGLNLNTIGLQAALAGYLYRLRTLVDKCQAMGGSTLADLGHETASLYSAHKRQALLTANSKMIPLQWRGRASQLQPGSESSRQGHQFCRFV